MDILEILRLNFVRWSMQKIVQKWHFLILYDLYCLISPIGVEVCRMFMFFA